MEILLTRHGYRPEQLPGVAAPTTTPLRIVLLPVSKVQGQAVDPDDRPVPAAEVLPSYETHLTGRPIARWPDPVSTAEDGRFLLEEVFPGRLGLRVSAEGFQTAEVAELEVLPGKDLEGVVVTLEPGGTVTGRVPRQRR